MSERAHFFTQLIHIWRKLLSRLEIGLVVVQLRLSHVTAYLFIASFSLNIICEIVIALVDACFFFITTDWFCSASLSTFSDHTLLQHITSHFE